MSHKYEPHEIQWTPERVANLWGYYSANPAYDETFFSMHSGQAVLEFLRKRIPLEGKQVLDFGCGRGHMLLHLLADGIACQGVKFSPEAARQAERNVGQHPLFGGVVRAQTLPTPLPDACVDVVFLIEVVEHLFEDQLLPTLNEVYRLLRLYGHIVATTPHAEDLDLWLNVVHCPECGCTFHRWQHMRSVTVASMSGLMKEAGFREVICRAVHFKTAGSWVGDWATGLQHLFRLRGRPVKLPHLVYVGQKPRTLS